MADDRPNPPAKSLPPNQALASPRKWPVVGETGPAPSTAPWRVKITGLVATPRQWSLADLAAMPQTAQTIDIHCVTRWSKLDQIFGGVPLATLLTAADPLPEAKYISFQSRSARGHSTSLPLADALTLDTLVALTHAGEPLAEIHGGPVRTVVPGRYFYKSLKWLDTIELLAEDRLGWWENESGYHNGADPWREQRYVVRNHDRRAIAAMFAARDIAGRDLLGLDGQSLDLPNLRAAGAVLRNADFSSAKLAGADFTGANLSNATLDGADLSGACLSGADAEGASFVGTDLTGANFTDCRLFGVTFCPEPTDADPRRAAARVNATTRIPPTQREALSDVQAAFLTDQDCGG